MSQPVTEPLREDQTRRAFVEVEIRRLTDLLAGMGATRVVLFGSRARGDALRGSDVDLLAVMPCPPGETFPSRLARVWQALQPRVPLDLLVYTFEELQELDPSRRFIRDALAEGKVIHAS